MFLIVLVLGLFNLLWGEKVPAGAGLGWDGVLYADMVRSLGLMISGGQLSSYYAQRILPSVIVRGMLLLSGLPISNSNIIFGYEIYNLALLLGACWAWKRISDTVHLSLAGRWIGFSGIFVNFACSKHAFYYPVLTDVSALFIAMLLLLFYVDKKPVSLFITTVIGAFCWPVVSVYGALLLLFIKSELPKDIVYPASSPFTIKGASINDIVIRSCIALFALSITGYIIMVKIGPLLDLQCKAPSFFVHAFPRFIASCTSRRELLGFERLITSIPSFAGLLIALAMLVGSKQIFRATINCIRKTQPTIIALSIAAVLVPFCIVKAISNPNYKSGGSLRGLIIGMFLPPEGKFLLPIVTLAVFFGPVLLLITLNWKEFCVESRKLGPGVVAIMGISMLLGLVCEPRFITAAWPLFVLVFVLTFKTLSTNTSFKYVLTALTILYAQFWMRFNLATWSTSDYEGLKEYPKQLYIMHYGLWMNWWSYIIQFAAIVLSAMWLSTTISKVGATDYE